MFHLISKSKSFTLVKSKSKNNCGTSLRWTSTFIPEPEVIQSILNQIKNLKNEKIKPHKYCDFHFGKQTFYLFKIFNLQNSRTRFD